MGLVSACSMLDWSSLFLGSIKKKKKFSLDVNLSINYIFFAYVKMGFLWLNCNFIITA
uniref:Uncharacterized protein n=1 Tax=Rhizophora mucronata TaxID=61149 RepID=A0A2P2MUK2_RHIMU